MLEENTRNGGCNFTARNYAKVYRTSVLTRAYCEHLALNFFLKEAENHSQDSNIATVLEKLGKLYGLWSLDKHLIYFYEGGYACGPNMAKFVKESILKLCADLKPEMMGVIDALAPPDYVLNSVLGKSDGKVIIFENSAQTCVIWCSFQPFCAKWCSCSFGCFFTSRLFVFIINVEMADIKEQGICFKINKF